MEHGPYDLQVVGNVRHEGGRNLGHELLAVLHLIGRHGDNHGIAADDHVLVEARVAEILHPEHGEVPEFDHQRRLVAQRIGAFIPAFAQDRFNLPRRVRQVPEHVRRLVEPPKEDPIPIAGGFDPGGDAAVEIDDLCPLILG